jgi:hypothetical protein
VRLKVILKIFLVTNEENASFFRSYKDQDTMTFMKYAAKILELYHQALSEILHRRVHVCVIYSRVSLLGCHKFNGEFRENL